MVYYNGQIKIWLVVDHNSCAEKVPTANVYFLKFYLVFVTQCNINCFVDCNEQINFMLKSAFLKVLQNVFYFRVAVDYSEQIKFVYFFKV